MLPKIQNGGRLQTSEMAHFFGQSGPQDETFRQVSKLKYFLPFLESYRLLFETLKLLFPP